MAELGVFGGVLRRKPPLSKNNMAAQLRFGKLNLLWRDETKVEMFGSHYSATFGENQAAHQQKNTSYQL